MRAATFGLLIVSLAAWPLAALSAPADISFALQAPARSSAHPAIDAAYASAMLDYRSFLLESGSKGRIAAPLLPQLTPLWRWRADDGGSLQRMEEGLFRLTKGDCISSLCVSIDCRAAGWPKFECADGQERRMSAPDLLTVVFDGTKYLRSLPERDDSDLDNDLP